MDSARVVSLCGCPDCFWCCDRGLFAERPGTDDVPIMTAECRSGNRLAPVLPTASPSRGNSIIMTMTANSPAILYTRRNFCFLMGLHMKWDKSFIRTIILRMGPGKINRNLHREQKKRYRWDMDHSLDEKYPLISMTPLYTRDHIQYNTSMAMSMAMPSLLSAMTLLFGRGQAAQCEAGTIPALA